MRSGRPSTPTTPWPSGPARLTQPVLEARTNSWRRPSSARPRSDSLWPAPSPDGSDGTGAEVVEAVILVGLQGAGKSSFYRERLFATHLRLSLDMLRTRHRERRLLQACVETGLRFVVDNTNPTRAERQ